MVEPDDDLRRRFRAAAGPAPDTDAAMVAVDRRVRRVRRRRAAAWSGGGLAAVAVLAMLVNRPEGRIEDRPATSEVVVSSTVGVPTTPTVDLSTTPATTPSSTSAPVETTIATTVDDPQPTSTDATAPPPAVTDAPSSTVPPTEPPATTVTPTPPTAAPTTETFSGSGGSVTVRLADGRLALVSYVPAAGFTAEVHDDSATRVEVRFRSDDHETVIRIDRVDGAMQPRVDEHG